MKPFRLIAVVALLLWGCRFTCAQEHDHTVPVAHECKCGPDCKCDPCACGEFIADGPILIANYAHHQTTVTVKDGEWFDPSVWSAGVPDALDVFKVGHAVRIAERKPDGDLNGDGVLDVKDYQAWDGANESIRRFLDAYFGLVVPSAGDAKALHGMVGKRGSLSIAAGSSLAVGTLHVLGDVREEGDVVIRDLAIDTTKDAMQWGIGVLVHSGGEYISRGGKVSSENPAGTRGHFAILHSGTADLEGTEFADLGRTKIGSLDNTQIKHGVVVHIGTNQMARYGGPHFHHCWGPAGLPEDVPQFRVSGCYIHDGSKWGITIHQSHFGLVQGNRIERCGGAGIAFEDGNEFANVVRGNRISGIFGDGKGVQGHNGGENVKDVGDGTPTNPFRTLGSHGNEGAGIWGRGTANTVEDNTVTTSHIGVSLWTRFVPDGLVKIPAAKGERPSKIVPAGDQLGYSFARNHVENCPTSYAIQGTVGDFVAKDCSCAGGEHVLDASYSDTHRFEGGEFQASRSAFDQLGFLGRLEVVGARVDSPRGAYITADGYLTDCVFTGKVTKAYSKTTGRQRTVIFDNVQASSISYVLGDYFNKRSYTIPEPLLLLNHGPDKQNYQLWFDEQRGDYVMPNTTSNRGRRQSPEAGLTNQQLWDKYKVCLGGKVLPADAFRVDGINAWVTPIPADITPPEFESVVIEPTATSVTIRVKTNEPTWASLEYHNGEITTEGYKTLQPATTELATEHVLTATGLKANTKYECLVRITDAAGNAGGDTVYGGLRYVTRPFKTRAN